MSDKALPHSTHAERVVLGSILMLPEALIEMAAWLKPEHFYHERHAQIYRAMLACYNRRSAPVVAHVADELRKAEQLETCGGIPYLIEISNEPTSAYYAMDPARTVEQTAIRRRGIKAGAEISRIFYDEMQEIELSIGLADTTLSQAVDRPGLRGAQPLKALIDQYHDYLSMQQERARNGEQIDMTGLRTGFVDFDRMTGGLQKSDLLILAARPGVGKSAFSMSMAFNIAMQQRAPVGVFSLEMGRDQLLQRLLATHTGIDSKNLRTGKLTTSEMITLVDAMGQMESAPIYIDDTPGVTVGELKAKCRRMQAEHGLELLVVDYLQLMSGSGKRNDNRVQEVSEISRELKLLARELNIPILALSQLSRAVEGRQSHVPVLADLRESGSLEQDADLVMFIYREEMYDKDTDKKGVAEIHIAKHRNGPLGVVNLYFDAQTTRFRDLAPYQSPEGY